MCDIKGHLTKGLTKKHYMGEELGHYVHQNKNCEKAGFYNDVQDTVTTTAPDVPAPPMVSHRRESTV